MSLNPADLKAIREVVRSELQHFAGASKGATGIPNIGPALDHSPINGPAARSGATQLLSTVVSHPTWWLLDPRLLNNDFCMKHLGRVLTEEEHWCTIINTGVNEKLELIGFPPTGVMDPNGVIDPHTGIVQGFNGRCYYVERDKHDPNRWVVTPEAIPNTAGISFRDINVAMAQAFTIFGD